MTTKNEKNGSLDFLNGRLNWNDKDPYWFRIIMALILGAVLITLVLVLKLWLIPAIASKKIFALKLFDFFKTDKERSP